MRRGILFCFLGNLLSAAIVLPSYSLAEDAADEAIIVTARRTEEKTNNVPLNINVIPIANITAGSVDNLQSLASHVPGLSFELIPGGGIAEPALRGQHQPSTAGDAVAMFVDGVYQVNRDAIDVEPLDLERIEVVHGPQSALFGHSSFAGLISYVPAQPTEKLFVDAVADMGTDNLFGMGGAISGPIGQTLKVRLAASWRRADGTWENRAAPGQSLGDSRKFAIAGTIATRKNAGPLSLRLSGRYGESRSTQPPFFTLDYRNYNCGARDPGSGYWSYFCGSAPIASQLSLSPGVPASRSYYGQTALHIALDLGDIELRSDTSYYRSDATAHRDGDGYAGGEPYGVCGVGVNCSGPASLSVPVLRLQYVDRVGRTKRSTREVAQEIRLSDKQAGRFGWQLGSVVYWTRSLTEIAVGAARGALAANERFTSLVLANPQRVGAPAFINNALAGDPNATQFTQNDATEYRRAIALFGAADYHLSERVRLRGEVRANWERFILDSRLANFRPSFGKDLGARTFFDLTPRLSVDYRPADGWLVYASHARGSRSGGINAIPNLLPQEQTYEPETNWTTELGVKYAGHGLIRAVQATGYYIDWRNAQILGYAVTPGVDSLIVHNTSGIETWGIELVGEVAPAPWLGIDAAYSYSHPRFKPGSEDPGGSAFCGIAPGITTSSFCRIVPSQVLAGQLAPDISGNRPSRAVEVSWTAGMTLAPLSKAFGGLGLRVEVFHQGNVYDRQINGLYYGERTLLNARLTLPLGALSAELWAGNLTDVRYIRSAGGPPHRQPLFYIGQPRPTDLYLGEGRRIGLTLRYTG